MASESRRAASRRNGAKGRGPKTTSGKARTRRNALRHGLRAIAFGEPGSRADVRRILKLICPRDADPLSFDQAATIAEAQVMLRRVRAARIAGIERLLAQDPEGAGMKGYAALITLDRYEREALSRRRRAMRRLAALACV